jgi:O-acetyl-ADP-ribose deacetylase (regulator of RNase III)
MERAARIALGEAKGWLSGDPSIGRCVFVLFGDEAYRSYAEALAELDG